MLAETNRHPFDLAEAESELVSGYNVEHSSVLFAVFFLAEYANILLLCHFASLLLLGGWTMPDFHYLLKILNLLNQDSYVSIEGFLQFIRRTHPGTIYCFHTIVYTTKVYLYLFAFVWVRATLPRYRYDQLMRLG
jgi:NADH-quinone oxidoreductase subunit H